MGGCGLVGLFPLESSLCDALKREVALFAKTNPGAPLHAAFLDLKQAFDSVEFWASDLALKRLRVPPKVLRLMQTLDTHSTRDLLTRDGYTDLWDSTS